MIGIFGGTFDPPHQGHIRLAEQALEQLALDEVQFLPCGNPVHRAQPLASVQHRLQMLALLIDGHAGFAINTVETDRGGPSYMVDSLRQLRAGESSVSYCLMLGVDAFNAIQHWKSPEEILALANLVVCRRPGIELDRDIYPSKHISSLATLKSKRCGYILPLDIEENPCSSTQVRAQLASRESVETCLSPTIIDYIHQHHLYET